jgi:hypothetical protein
VYEDLSTSPYPCSSAISRRPAGGLRSGHSWVSQRELNFFNPAAPGRRSTRGSSHWRVSGVLVSVVRDLVPSARSVPRSFLWYTERWSRRDCSSDLNDRRASSRTSSSSGSTYVARPQREVFSFSQKCRPNMKPYAGVSFYKTL